MSVITSDSFPQGQNLSHRTDCLQRALSLVHNRAFTAFIRINIQYYQHSQTRHKSAVCLTSMHSFFFIFVGCILLRHTFQIYLQSQLRLRYIWKVWFYVQTNKLHGLSPRANYTDRATAACRRSGCQLLRIEGATWSAWRIPTAVLSVF
jgi:hypothetical protein